MDKGLRITVGNDVYYEKAGPSAHHVPRNDLRGQSNSRMDQYARIQDERQEIHRERPPPPHHGQDRGPWPSHDVTSFPFKQPQQWFGERGFGNRERSPGGPYIPLETEKNYPSRHSPPSDHRHDIKHWSPSRGRKPLYHPEIDARHAKRDHRDFSGKDYRNSPHRHQSPSYKFSRSPHHGYSRSPVHTQHSRSPHYRQKDSPNQRHSRSPYRRQTHSAIRRHSRSPYRRQSRSPIQRQGRSPYHRQSRSPIQRHSRSPYRRQSHSPIQKHSRSPYRRQSRSPIRRHSRSPYCRQSHSPIRRHSRSPYRRKSLSPLHRHSRSPYRRQSRSPVVDHRRSPDHKRSPFHQSKARHPLHKRQSSSESNDSRARNADLKHRSGSAKHLRPDDELLLSMYSKWETDSDDQGTNNYLHPVLDKSKSLEERALPGLQLKKRQSSIKAYINPEAVGGQNLKSLAVSYSDELPFPSKKSANQKKLDEEDTFLYGEGSAPVKNSEKTYDPSEHGYHQSHVEVSKMPESESGVSDSVTPGGFNTHALKNVLKAIGFDFERSAQSVQNAASTLETHSLSSSSATNSLSVAISKLSSSSDQPKSMKAQPIYEPAQHVPPAPIPQNIYPTRTIPSSQAGLYMFPPPPGVYPPANISTIPQQIVYQSPMSTNPYMPIIQPALANASSDNARPNLKVVPIVSKESMTDHKSKDDQQNNKKSTKQINDERKARKKRLDYLETELENLKKKQDVLVRKKRRQANKGDQELMRQNSLLQAGVEKQIQEIRLAAERAVQIKHSSESSDDDVSSSEDERNYDYIDAGDHFCKDCNVTCKNLMNFLDHLHSKRHKKLMDPNLKPWHKRHVTKEKFDHASVSSLKGPQFLFPVNAYYCQLCKHYSGDQESAEGHCKRREHNLRYLKYCKNNPDYEKGYRYSALQGVAERIKKLKQEQTVDSSQRKKHQQIVSDMDRFKDEKSQKQSDKSSKMRSVSPRSDRNFEPQKNSPKPRGRSPARVKVSPATHHDVSQYEKRLASPRRRRSVSPRGAESARKAKRRFEESYQPKAEKRRNRGSRWSPGYDALEKTREIQEREAAKPKPPMGGKSFGKFTWKRVDKIKQEKVESETPTRDTGPKKISLKIPPKPSPNVVARPMRTKAGLSDKLGNFAPHTTVVKSKQNQQLSPTGKLSGSVPRPADGNNSSPAQQLTIPSVASYKATSMRGKRNLRPRGKVEELSPPQEAVPKNTTLNLCEITVDKSEPPPPGTEDIFEDGVNSDASGISMEIGSDEGP